MKILYVMGTSSGIGGLEQHSFNLSRLMSQSHEVHFIADQHYQQYFQQQPLTVFHAVNFSKSRLNPCFILHIFRLIKKIQPDIIHVQGGKAAKIISILLPYLKISSVVTVHGMKNHLYSYRRFDAIIAVSQRVADRFHQFKNVHTIYNGIELPSQTFRPNINSQRRVVAVGRLDPVKAFDQLIIAWQEIDYPLDIIGEGSQRPMLTALIEKLGLQDKVRLLGYKQDILAEINNSQLLVISSHKEGGPIVLAEALLLKVPVVATNVGMVAEFLPKPYIVESAHSQHLKQSIQSALDNLAQLELDFLGSFTKAEHELSLHRMYEKTFSLYHDLVKYPNLGKHNDLEKHHDLEK
ncbi:glycosyltransferase [Acinetobacter larvae]|uniref:Glycosyltransferase n=1 Tax=Acinetobacter larvae TaxID=1789224 RepID=A0A1B2M3V7_9GAMM|nr:glycosyltransferase [Acinetobacter larvae]AOA59849.1 hypothetical protein BFG52_03250 [Acinetobacter larvae]